MTLKPEHIVEALNKTPELKRRLILRIMEELLDSEAFMEAYPRLYDPAAAEASPEYREKVREELAQMRNIRDGSLEMRIFKGRFGERVTLPVREVVEHETSGTGHKLIFDTYFALKDQYERDEVWM